MTTDNGIMQQLQEKQHEPRTRFDILVSAYACEPGAGSEPGIGWNWVHQFARRHNVFVITRSNNRDAIEAALTAGHLNNVHPIYVDFPRWARFWKKGQAGIHVYYHLWQVCAWFAAQRLLRTTHIDIAHHITLGMYWKPSMLAFVPVPFLLGPVGGGEECPKGFLTYFGLSHAVFELARKMAQAVARLDPFVRLTAKRAVYSIATTTQTAERLRELGCTVVDTISQVALPASEVEMLTRIPIRRSGTLRLLSIGRLQHWKGFELALRAFAEFRAAGGEGEYWIIGDGPARTRLVRTARALGVAGAVSFLGAMERTDVLHTLAECDVLAHPSLHDSGGWVCVEAMAAGRPVVCLDWGGPPLAVSRGTGITISVKTPQQVIHDLAQAFHYLDRNRNELRRMASAARERASTVFTWDSKGDVSHLLLQTLVNRSN
jgi:glycosyltransferase involved in cell wall biosynthesis